MDLRKLLTIAARVAASLPVPTMGQKTDYNCGPATLSAVLKMFGVEADEGVLEGLAGTSETYGADADKLAEAARKLGLQAEVLERMTLEEVEACLLEGKACIVCVQAHHDDGPAHDYSEDLDYGHYVAPVQAGSGWMTVMDPWTEDEATLSLDDLRERWHMGDGEKRVESVGVVVWK